MATNFPSIGSSMSEKRAYNHLLLRSRPGMHYLSALSLEDLSEIPHQTFDLPFLNPNLPVTATSCGGLLYFDDCFGYVYLCNPTTKQFRSYLIESSLAISGAGPGYGSLGYDYNSDDFKIVWFHRQHGARVYSLKKDVWKKIPDPFSLVAKPMAISPIIVSLTGTSYWLGILGKSSVVISFDFMSEAFSAFPLPKLPHLWLGVEHLLIKLDVNLLGVVCYWRKYGKSKADRGYFYQLWAWRVVGIEQELMFKEFVAKLEWDLVCETALCDGAGKPIGLVGSFLLLEGMTAVGLPDPSRMIVYNWTTGERRELNMHDRPASIALSCMESDILLPEGHPVVTGSVVNNAEIPDDDIYIVVHDEGHVDYGSEVDMDSVWREEDEYMRLMNLRLKEEAEEIEEREQMAVASDLDDKMKKIDAKIASMIDSMFVSSKIESKEYKVPVPGELLPTCASDIRRRRESYAEYEKISGIDLGKPMPSGHYPLPKDCYDCTQDNNPVISEYTKFMYWYNEKMK